MHRQALLLPHPSSRVDLQRDVGDMDMEEEGGGGKGRGGDQGRKRDMTWKKNKEIHVNESSARKKRGRMKRHQDEMCVADS